MFIESFRGFHSYSPSSPSTFFWAFGPFCPHYVAWILSTRKSLDWSTCASFWPCSLDMKKNTIHVTSLCLIIINDECFVNLRRILTCGLGLVQDLSKNRTPPPQVIPDWITWSVSFNLTHSDFIFDHGDHSPLIVKRGRDAVMHVHCSMANILYSNIFESKFIKNIHHKINTHLVNKIEIINYLYCIVINASTWNMAR